MRITFPPDPPMTCDDDEELGRGMFRALDDIPVTDGRGNVIHVIRKGARSDGVSLPRLARPWFGSWGRSGLPAFFHDDLLNTRPDLPKRTIDWLFLGALHDRGVPDFQAMIFYLAVRTRRRSTPGLS